MDAVEFASFFRATAPALSRYVARLGGPHLSDDVVAETMSTLWRKDLDPPRSEEEQRSLQGLAYRVAEGHLRNQLRAERRRSALTRRLSSQARLGVDDLADTIEADADVSARLASVRRSDRAVIALVMDGFTMAEIAAALDCSVPAAKMRVLRARNTLRAILAREASHD